MCQNDKEAWDQVLPQIFFVYRFCPHTSTGQSPYTVVHGRDSVLPIHKLIKVTTPYQGESSLGKSIDQSRVALSIAPTMLERMRKNQKRTYECRKKIHQLKVDDLVLLKKHAQEKLDLKLEPNYRIIRLPTAWTAVIEHTVSGRTRRCNVWDLQKKHPLEDWQLKASNVGRAAKFVNHPSNLPEVEDTLDKPDNCGNGKSTKGGHKPRKSIKPKQRLDL